MTEVMLIRKWSWSHDWESTSSFSPFIMILIMW